MCGGEFEGVMYDALILHDQLVGQWKNICRKCFHKSGSKLGIGFGQMYTWNGKGEFEGTKG
jgi:hypothetical protein